MAAEPSHKERRAQALHKYKQKRKVGRSGEVVVPLCLFYMQSACSPARAQQLSRPPAMASPG